MARVILASTSPRRIELMKWLEIPYEAIPSLLDEKSIRDTNPAVLTQKLAKGKAESVKNSYPDAIVIGSDSVGEFEGEILEKVADIDEQRRLIKAYKGKNVLVYTSIYIIDNKTRQEFKQTVINKCIMTNYSDELMEKYIRSGVGMGKAGGMGVQDENGAFVKKIEGCYTAALGFPICGVCEGLRKMGVNISVDIKNVVREKTGQEC